MFGNLFKKKIEISPAVNKTKQSEKIVLLVLDGFGVNPKIIESPWKMAKHPTFEEIEKFYPFTALQASGISVGLPFKEEGNSEVGHLTMGAGKIVYTALPRISFSIEDGSFFENEALLFAMFSAKKNKTKLHLIGLFSSGSVHAYANHLYALLELAKKEEAPEVYLHLFTDGRDAPRAEGAELIKKLEQKINENYPNTKIASLIGRDFAMGRDGHFDKIQKTYELLTKGEGIPFKIASDFLKGQYEKNLTDEFIPPAILTDENEEKQGIIQNKDNIVFFNFREDSMREICSPFLDKNFKEFSVANFSESIIVTMTEYAKWGNLVAFPPVNVLNPLSKVLAAAGKKQIHIAETEKYAHVTYFFNGGREEPFLNEDRVLIPSPKDANFEEVPEMSADKVAETVIGALPKYDFIMANFANADMVGHTGNFHATVRALEIIDSLVQMIMKAVFEADAVLIITGDHGNAEEKLYEFSAERKTKHSANPVPFYLISENLRRKEPLSQEKIKENYKKTQGSLMDIAPTILDLMDIPKPEEMTGISLLDKLE